MVETKRLIIVEFRPTPRMTHANLVKKREIVLHSRDLGDGDLATLCDVLRDTQVLEVLNLSCNRITLADGNLTDALARNKTLRALYLSQNEIGDAGAQRLAAALGANETLQNLGLDGNRIRGDGARSLAGALATNGSLLRIALNANGIDDEGARCLAVCLEKNRSLRDMSLCGNSFCGEGAQSLANALECNHVLESLNLGMNRSCSQSQDWKCARARIQVIFNDPERKLKRLEMIIAKKDEEITAKDAMIAKIRKKDDQIAKLKASLKSSGAFLTWE